ncbi:unnamed protein product [Enterobius vermicularis]|uniref:ShTK domain protein n=1 Tax=Enterobius vermicularis TaxID=51028 RepID=A0A0N4V588_ENTVE|nr:unnamed protein product [Enterobius vermicularis]
MTCCRDPAYQCEDNKSSHLNCTGIAEFGGCVTEVPWIALMLQKECPHSCGLCEVSFCADKSEMCPLLAEICNHKIHEAAASNNCADSAPECHGIRNLCHVPEFAGVMKEKCKRTCNFCEVDTTHKTACKDSMMSCPLWDRIGFCADKGYTVQQKRYYCMKTCGYC